MGRTPRHSLPAKTLVEEAAGRLETTAAFAVIPAHDARDCGFPDAALRAAPQPAWLARFRPRLGPLVRQTPHDLPAKTLVEQAAGRLETTETTRVILP